MSRKTLTTAAGGLAIVAMAIWLWPKNEVDDTGQRPVIAPGSAAMPESIVQAAPQTPDATANSGASATPLQSADSLDAYRLFGQAVQFMPGDRCNADGDCRQEPVPLHAYANYTDEQLKTLSVFDGQAALVLANRLGRNDPAQARHYAARAFMLTADPYAFHMARQLSGVNTGMVYQGDGQLDLVAAQRAYVWIKLGYELGASDLSTLAHQRAILDEHGFRDFDALDALADASRRDMENTRLQLVGEGF
ncbi:MAG: hypothetical protein AAF660_08705 [Pseudomonadota bacterium]